MPKRPRRRRSSRPPPAGRAPKKKAAAAAPAPAPAPAERSLLYKVVELSTVDERGLEGCVNEWVGKGWHLEGVQFAMRESSKRPSMAFVFFTREQVSASSSGRSAPEEARGDPAALARLARIASAPVPSSAPEIAPDFRGGAYDGSLQPYREIDPEDLEGVHPHPVQGEGNDIEARTWPDRPERATDPWARLQALANSPDEDEGDEP